jgi:peptide/nickel transport system ATP-binding protein/oligopeptide transport system ATP-binding protein
MTIPSPLVQAKEIRRFFQVRTRFGQKKQYIKAVDGVTLDIFRGETLGLVGESGCGKSTLGRLLLGLYPLESGTVTLGGQPVTANRPREMMPLRRRMQLIFQDPSASMNPRQTVHDILLEPFRIHKEGSRWEREKQILRLLELVGLSEYHLSRYPHELSGGQKQRVGVARAVALKPEFIVCDEAVSALDVSIQAQVINLLEDLQKEFSLTYLFISHNLNVIHHFSDRVGVMYLGRLVEVGKRSEIYHSARHPYTWALLSAIPRAFSEERGQRILLKGDAPSPINPPSGCHFHPRCPHMLEICRSREPPDVDLGGGHHVVCHLY